ncbi:NAD(P)-dependent oxidoreductase [Leptolyngbya sp. FACHB-261]|uniref:NAD-dependent epimerase/dehydratase family protein n=1 Tax=Leptolyngbya sp. FACHB-261 TaxID=2692806 RepID=UPI001684F36C|nr:NAD(P)-dependent oxidoreductase [Leptolyngbya sp. FACHB-261]MBD2103922.1 NAD(P)-dependent oxidoreductase [Leptolyngbya sp. FACHB-261]
MPSAVIAGADTELGQETVRQLVALGYQVTGLVKSKDGATTVRSNGGLAVETDLTNAAELKEAIRLAKAEVILNLTPQFANTLLSDGQDWKGFDKTLSATTSALLEAIKDTDIKLLIHASYAFLYGNTASATENSPLIVPGDDPIFKAAIAAENQVAQSSMPTCVLRLGYLYGPQSEDLKLYIKSFKLGRPYFAGPVSNLGNWLHFEDAAQALAQVAKQQPIGMVFNVVDGTPVSFTNFIDQFAFTLGRKRPSHIPLWLTPLALVLVVTPQQVELLKLSTHVNSDLIRQQLGWSPRYTSYREGLQQTVETWSHNEVKPVL